jgi:hypothetical protein
MERIFSQQTHVVLVILLDRKGDLAALEKGAL